MAWSERQHAMLRAMGLRVWSAPLVGQVADRTEAQIGALTEAQIGALTEVQIEVQIEVQTEVQTEAHTRAPEHALPLPASGERAGVRGGGRARSSQEPNRRADQHGNPSAPAAAPPQASDARAQRIATLDWPALREEVAGCRSCTLCETRKQTVFGVGDPHAHWLVVGEAPGEQEDLQGEPFVGAAGQLLDSMLHALGLTRSTADPAVPAARRVYIANTLKCRPPRNRNPEPGEILQCEPFLVRQIELLKPRTILAMGRFAVQALLRTSEPVGALRGRVHRYQGVPLVVTYHPAYLLRNMLDKARAWDDLCLAATVAERAETR